MEYMGFSITAGELAERIGAVVEGDAGVELYVIRRPEDAGVGALVYIEGPREAAKLEGRRFSAAIVSRTARVEGAPALLRCENPKAAFAAALRIFYPPEVFEGGVHPTAVVEPGAVVYRTAAVGANCYVGAGALVEGAVVWPNCYIGRNVKIGEKCVLHPGVAVLDRCELGKRVILHSGVVIGADGFGYVREEGMHIKVPQVGNVVLEDDVEIGANSAVDRATLGTTRVGRGTKIDNLVQVGHNVTIGSDCVICGSVGISGSVEIGDGVIMGGQVGVSDHVRIGDGCILGGRTAVIENVPARSFYSGFPARPHRRTMKIFSALDKLPDLLPAIERLLEEHMKDNPGAQGAAPEPEKKQNK